jgi:hypothetical protein
MFSGQHQLRLVDLCKNRGRDSAPIVESLSDIFIEAKVGFLAVAGGAIMLKASIQLDCLANVNGASGIRMEIEFI